MVCEFPLHVLDILDQGWIVLRYPYGDYFSGCKDYAVTEILFTCDHSDQLVSISTYSSNLSCCLHLFSVALQIVLFVISSIDCIVS